MSWLRAFAAAALSVLFPGAGHALLRDWLRALVFAGLYLATIAIVLPPTEQLAAAESASESMELLTGEIDAVEQFILSFIYLFAAIDATFRALGYPPGANSGASSDAPTCPECGKELDEELAFCHWCTARLEPRDGDDADEERVSS